ncbi:MAG: ABC transporter ATP-binding protein [Oscillospiraceae bacterium]|nr:ABC transporter ATP-binding protein [Oscillospiraceae bacterium]
MGAMMPAEKPRDFKGTMRRLLEVLRPHRAALLFVLIASMMTTVFLIVTPKILGRAIDIITVTVKSRIAGGSEPIDYQELLRILVIVGLIYVVSSFFTWWGGYVMAGISQKISFSMRQSIDRKLTRLPLRYFDSTPRGEIISRVTNDMDNISMTLQQGLTQVISSVTTLVGILIMMLTISPLLTLVGLITIPLAAIITVLIAKKSQKYFADMWASTGHLNGQIEEMYTGQTIVRLFNRQAQAGAEFDRENQILFKSSFKAQFVSGIVMPAMHLIENLNYVILCVVGGLQIISGNITLGDITAFITYSKQFTQPITQTASIINTMQSTVASAERVFDLMDTPEETPDSTSVLPITEVTSAFPLTDVTSALPITEVPVADAFPQVRGEIRFENVRFSYKEDVPLIENMNLHVLPGQTVAIVGPTGAGKTTLVNLLMRFYDIQNGKITLDGTDIREIPRDELRGDFGMVLQDTWLFSGTIRENIAYGISPPDEPTEEGILAASRAAYVDHFVRTLPDGYDTVLTDEAGNLSQGQKQLLTIARAFLSDPRILILDEATSSVDTRTELLIQKAMSRLMTGRTSFVIAHRLSTIRDADIILVMDQGNIVEQGTHEALLEAKGFYHELYHSQFRSGIAEAI